MKIGIDARPLNNKIFCGGKRLLASFLKKAASERRGSFSFYLFHSEKSRVNFGARFHNVNRQHGRAPLTIDRAVAWEQFDLPALLNRHKIRLYHAFHAPIPCSQNSNCKMVLTIFDVAPWRSGEQNVFLPAYQAYLRKWLPPSLKRADAIIAISKHTQSEICNLFGISPKNVKVIYPILNACFRLLPDKGKARTFLKRKLGIERPFVLNCNVLSPRKNIETLIAAFRNLKKREKIPHVLLITGASHHYKIKVRDRDVILLGMVSDLTLRYLYNCADLFVYPSLGEGFGYPPLEAMACGTPVISSNTGSLPEVIGKGGLLVDPSDMNGFADSILNVLKDGRLKECLMNRGFERAKYFSSSERCREIFRLYERILKS